MIPQPDFWIVNKRLTIRSENGSASTTVQASNTDDHVFEVTADYEIISGFTVTGATGTGNTIGGTDKGNNIIANGVYNSMTDGYEWAFYNDQNVEVDATYNYFIGARTTKHG